MWTTWNYGRAIASVATAGAVVAAAGGVTATPVSAYPPALPVAAVSAPVQLTALTDDSSLMDIIGELTGLTALMHFLDDPESPLFPFVLGIEALGEIFVVMPLVLIVGTPLLLITEGLDGFQDLFTQLGTVVDAVTTLFDGIGEWYETHNWLTGELLDAGSSVAVDLSGLDAAFTPVVPDDVLVPDLDLSDLIA